jgi:hypothetical protein
MRARVTDTWQTRSMRSTPAERTRMSDYDTRVADARQAVAALAQLHRRGPLPTGLHDQLDAAARDTTGLFRAYDGMLRILAPDRDWQLHESTSADPRYSELAARTLATIAAFRVCAHLRHTPAQPAIVRLAIRRIDCHRCTATHVNPPAGEDDRCDWCGQRGVTTFWPVSYTLGVWLVGGDACRACAEALHPAQVP